MFRLRRVNIFLSLCLVAVILLLVLYDEDEIDISWLFAPKVAPEAYQILCYKNESLNHLKSISTLDVRRNASIFFVETKCHYNGINLSPRQACAVESAARMNPDMDVYVLIPSPVSKSDEISTPKHIEKLVSYKNVKIAHVNMDEYFNNTPLEDWYRGGKLKSSRWPQSHASDLLRYATLWKYGGIYIDLDVILIRSFKGMLNFAGAESNLDVAAGFLSFHHGHDLAEICVQDLKYNFRGYLWGHNGPGVITRSLKKFCKVKEVEDMTPENCSGFKVFKPYAFYPIPWKKWALYFTRENSEEVMDKFRHSYAIHVWNKFSSKRNITIGSKQPYGQLASKYCPKVYFSLDKYF